MPGLLSASLKGSVVNWGLSLAGGALNMNMACNEEDQESRDDKVLQNRRSVNSGVGML